MSVVEQTIRKAVGQAFDFEIEKRPMIVEGGIPTDQCGLVRVQDGKEEYVRGVQSVSRGYQPHTTEDCVALAEAAAHVFAGNQAEIKVDCYWRAGHYITISPPNEHRRAIYGTGDNIFPRLTIRAGFNKQSFRGSLGYFRDTCSNLAMLSNVSRFTTSIRHDTNLRPRMDELVERFSQLGQSWIELQDLALGMQKREVHLAQFLEQVFGKPDQNLLDAHMAGAKVRAVTTHQKRIEQIFRRVQRERDKTGRPEIDNKTWLVSEWEAFNGVQGYVQHDQGIRRNNDSEWERIIRASRSKYVRRASELCMSV